MGTTSLDFVHLSHLGAAYVSEEGSFCGVGTEVRCHPIADSLEATPTQETVDVHTLSPIAFDAETPVAGDKGGTLKVGYYLAPAANALLSGVTPPTDAEMPLRPFLRCLFGGESCLAGSDVATGTSATSIDVTTGHGSRFLPGQLFAVSTDDTVGFEVVQSRSRSTDTVTMYPALSDTPATGRDVMNLVTYYLTNANSRSLSIAVSPGGNANRQWRFRGCTGGVALKFEKGQLASTEFNLTAATHDGPDALSYAVTRSEDPLAAPISCRNMIMWLQPVATTTRVNTVVDSLTVTLNTGMSHLGSLTGTTEGKRGTIRSEGLIDSAATWEMVMPDCEDVYTWRAANTELCVCAIAKVDGADGARRFIVAMSPQCVIEKIVEPMKGDKNQSKIKVSLRAKISEQCSPSTSEMARSPFVLGIG
jgi:hypothetical protein